MSVMVQKLGKSFYFLGKHEKNVYLEIEIRESYHAVDCGNFQNTRPIDSIVQIGCCFTGYFIGINCKMTQVSYCKTDGNTRPHLTIHLMTI